MDVANELHVGVCAEFRYCGDVCATWVLTTPWTAARVDNELEEESRIGGDGAVERSPGGRRGTDIDGECNVCGEDVGDEAENELKGKWEVEILHPETDDGKVYALMPKALEEER